MGTLTLPAHTRELPDAFFETQIVVVPLTESREIGSSDDNRLIRVDIGTLSLTLPQGIGSDFSSCICRVNDGATLVIIPADGVVLNGDTASITVVGAKGLCVGILRVDTDDAYDLLGITGT